MAEWRFLLDENIDPKVATYLEKADISAIHIRDSLGLGADDETDILPYAREHDRIVLTSDVTDFAPLPSERHAGLVLLYDDTMPAYRVASALIALVEAYQSRERFGGREALDDWA
jgi:predicted nuclease of predicted toxin-antitoxin system